MSLPSKNRLTAFVVAVVLLGTTAAHAAAPRLEIPADASDCPSASELRRAIVSQTGHDDFDLPDAPDVVVRIRRAADASLAADVSMTKHAGAKHAGATSSRTIDNADSCNDLVRAAALSIALAMEEDAGASPDVTKETSLPPSTPDEQVGPPGGRVQADRVVMTASALTSLGLLPRPAAGGGVAGRVRVSEMVWLSARGFWLPEASMPNDDFTMRLLGVGAGACVEPFATRSVAAVGCGHLLGGSFDVTRATVDMASTGPEAYVAASVSLGVRARVLGPLHLEAAADAQLPFVRPTYLTTTCPPRGFEPAFLAVAVWLGAGVSFR